MCDSNELRPSFLALYFCRSITRRLISHLLFFFIYYIKHLYLNDRLNDALIKDFYSLITMTLNSIYLASKYLNVG